MKMSYAFAMTLLSVATVYAEPIEIGSRLELFTDDFLIESMNGDLSQVAQQPTPHDVIITTDEPWEGNTCAYYTIFQDGDIYRMYYRGSHVNEKTQKSLHPEVTCYAESTDGIHWTKPNLGLIEYNGSKENNIVWDGIGTHCFVPFKDTNPNCSADAKYKAISRGRPQGKKGLYVFKSPDGIRWSLMNDEPVITEGAFDSQNLAFWNPHTKQYVDFHRTFTKGVRDIMTCTSDDFINWTKPVLLKYPGAEHQHLYTNAIRSYDRAPHLLVGFPTRYLPKDSQVEPVFMSSRDGVTFTRYNDPIVPRDAPEDRQGNRSNYMVHGLVEIPTEPGRMSVFATEAYYVGPDTRVRRFSYRTDGFVALHSGQKGGELITKPIQFSGDELILNYSARKGGAIQVELQDADGNPISGYTSKDCKPLNGDSIEQVVHWKNEGKSLKNLSEKPIRVKFLLNGADLFSFQFRDRQ